MQRKIYCPLHSDFKNFYQSQAGSGYSDIEVFRGAPYQRGYGLGSLFSRFALPVLKYLGRHALKTGVNVGKDILEKKKFKSALKERGKEELKSIARETLTKADSLLSQQGKGLKRKLYKSKKVKKRKKDIFG